MKLFKFILWFALVPSVAFADPGAVDNNDCHSNQETKKYHCHGTSKAPKASQILIGASAVSHSWWYSDGLANIFGGVAGSAEYVYKSMAVYGNYGYQQHLTGYNWFTLKGWDAGVKFGKNLSRLGPHVYASAGWYSQKFYQSASSVNPTVFNGYTAGIGYAINFDKVTIDAKVQTMASSDQELFWQNAGFPSKMSVFSSQLSYYFRF